MSKRKIKFTSNTSRELFKWKKQLE